MADKMTIEQAIICLDFFKSDNPMVEKSERLKLALELAIEALKQQERYQEIFRDLYDEESNTRYKVVKL